jgi:hypothetical protein
MQNASSTFYTCPYTIAMFCIIGRNVVMKEEAENYPMEQASACNPETAD